MSMKQIVSKQYRDKVNSLSGLFAGLDMPKEGWLRTVRKALNMSGAQLARRMGVTRGLVSNTEKAEVTGNVTIRKMQDMANALNCRFVYAVVPDEKIEKMIQAQAYKKAREQVKLASTHMALEAQTLSDEQLEFEIERLANELMDKMSSEIWEKP